MSRIGNNPVPVPAGVNVTISGNNVSVEGPKGKLSTDIPGKIKIEKKEDRVILTRANDEKASKSFHGLGRSLINNMIVGVSEGFSKELIVEGVGFKANLNGKNLKLALGFSHDVNYEIPEGIELSVDKQNIKISGIDKQLVGHVAADIRSLKKPEPYKGKGIRYTDEQILRKAGKAAAGTE